MGDDVVDLPPMLHCGLAIAVPDSPALLLEHAHYVTKKAGGRGAVREVCELIMQAQNTWEAQMAQFLTQANIAN
jgi:3-deoxy-D-manno-octulosonate 8-phosphate phosphatase (KDO 8-P phosphatase)